MKKLLLHLFAISICFFLVCNQTFAQSSSDPNLNDSDYIVGSEKNPALAFGCSLILPGLGQMYNENLGFGFTLMGFSMLGGIIAFEISDNDELQIPGLVVLVGSYFISLIEAPIAASRITKEVRRKKALLRKHGHSFGFIINDSVIGVDLLGSQNGIMLKTSVHF